MKTKDLTMDSQNSKVKSARKKSRKLSVALAIYCLIVLLLLSTLTSFSTGNTIQAIMTRKQSEYFTAVQNDIIASVELYVDKYVTVVETVAADDVLADDLASSNSANTFSDFESNARVASMLSTVKDTHSEIVSFGIGDRSEDAVFIEGGTAYTETALSENAINDAILYDTTLVTDPYIDPASGILSISVCAPVHRGSSVVGMVYLDIDLEHLSDILFSTEIGETGFGILTTADGVIIADTTNTLAGKNISEGNMSADIINTEISNPTGNIFSYDKAGVPSIAVAQKTNNGWNIIIGMSTAEYNADTVYTIFVIISALVFMLVVATIAITIYINKKTKPISYISEGLLAMSEGNMTFDLPDNISNDEVGGMISALTACKSELSRYISEIDSTMQQMSQGNLTTRITTDFVGDFASIKSSVNSFADKMSDLISQISDASSQVSAAAGQVASGAQALAQGATQQAATIDDLTNLFSEVSVQAEQNSQDAIVASTASTEAGSYLAECSQTMSELKITMEDINAKSQQISGIIKTIDDIAFQTNILALNAAVEAARAGSAGKGFAVVADEVRTLATKSAEASSAISGLIENSINAIQLGFETTQKTVNSMDLTGEKASHSVELVSKIVDASSSQSQSINSATEAMSQIFAVVQSNSATSEESAAASEQLSAQAEQLSAAIRKFKV